MAPVALYLSAPIDGGRIEACCGMELLPPAHARFGFLGNEGERAVSPVIGAVLMVTITGILAAVIAAFVLDMGDSVGQEAQAGTSVDGGTVNHRSNSRTMKSKQTEPEQERAVSPAIGSILMVTITVILAAVIAAFVLDMSDGVGQEAQAGIEVSSSGETVTANWISSGNADNIDLSVEVVGTDNSNVGNDELDDYDIDPADGNLDSSGDSESFVIAEDEGDTDAGDRVDVRVISTGNLDGESTVVDDSAVTVTAAEE